MSRMKTSLVSLQTFCRYTMRRRICQHAPLMNLSIPQPEDAPKTPSPKIEQIVASITQLSLFEVAELSDLLKKRLNLPDAPVMNFATAAAAPAPSTEAVEEEIQSSAPVQTSFQVKMIKYDEAQKIPIIKELKAAVEGMNLVQAKKFVESLPGVVKGNLAKDEAEKLKEQLSKLGAEVQIV